MTIVTTITKKNQVFGNLRMHIGTCTNDSTGGDVVTGLSNVEIFIPINLGGTAAEIAVNESFPLAGGTVTVVTESSIAFAWIAIGL